MPHNAKKIERRPFGIFQHPFYRKTSKKLKGRHFGEKKVPKKSHNAEKTVSGPLGFFNISAAKHQESWKKFCENFEKKSYIAEKNWKGTL